MGNHEKWLKTGKYWKIPCKAAITKSRQRLGQECNETVVSSIGTTNGYDGNSRSISQGIESCSNRWNLFRHPLWVMKMAEFLVAQVAVQVQELLFQKLD
jgi:hypothetical protein